MESKDNNHKEYLDKVYKEIFFEMMRLGKSYGNTEIYKTNSLGFVCCNLN